MSDSVSQVEWLKEESSTGFTPSVYQQLIADKGIESVTARMTEDWLDAVRALRA
jgi:hypothetical protein